MFRATHRPSSEAQKCQLAEGTPDIFILPPNAFKKIKKKKNAKVTLKHYSTRTQNRLKS
jgi:hypothetical protein